MMYGVIPTIKIKFILRQGLKLLQTHIKIPTKRKS